MLIWSVSTLSRHDDVTELRPDAGARCHDDADDVIARYDVTSADLRPAAAAVWRHSTVNSSINNNHNNKSLLNKFYPVVQNGKPQSLVTR